MSPSPREGLLERARTLVSSDRDSAYGDPGENLGRIAAMWTAAFGRPFTAADVALAMILVKASRLAHDPSAQDSWTDVAGYAALGAEVAPDVAGR